MIEVRYISSNKKEYNLIGDKMRPTDGVFHEYEWTQEVIERKVGETVTGFTKASKTYQITLTIRGKLEDRKTLIDDLTDSFEHDVVNVSPGRIYFGDWYIDCYIKEKTTGISGTWNNWTELVIGVYCPYPSWIHKESRTFSAISNNSESDSFLDYEHDYNYDYTMPYGGDVIWQVDHYAPCEYEMIIYGPCVDPRVVINGHIYQVFATLDENDYLKINSRENSVVQYLANGTQRDLYDYRVKITGSLFEPITPGSVRVVWSGEFGFDLTLFCERSEPRWTSKNQGDDTNTSDINLQNKVVNPAEYVQNIKADSGYDGLNQVTVNAIPEAYANTSDADATSNDIVSPKTAYVDGEKIIGTLTRQVLALTAGMVLPSGADAITASYLNIEMADKRIFYDAGDNVQLRIPLSNFGDATADDVAAGKTFTSKNGYKVTGTGLSGGTSGLQLKTGKTSEAVIDTGLSSIIAFGIAAMSAATGVGLCNAMFNSYEDADHANMSYCNSSSDYLKMYTYTASSSYFSISGGVFEWTGAGNYALQEGMEYQWFAIGT